MLIYPASFGCRCGHFYIDRCSCAFCFKGISMSQILKGRFDGSKAAGRTASREIFSERFTIDQTGRRVLAGLSFEETREFETLDALPPPEGERISWTFGGQPSTQREKRWLELYTRHNEAWKARKSGNS